jgi:hypothetical protein
MEVPFGLCDKFAVLLSLFVVHYLWLDCFLAKWLAACFGAAFRCLSAVRCLLFWLFLIGKE